MTIHAAAPTTVAIPQPTDAFQTSFAANPRTTAKSRRIRLITPAHFDLKILNCSVSRGPTGQSSTGSPESSVRRPNRSSTVSAR
jgi:hypothetical protein